MNRLFGWWLRVPRRVRVTLLTVVSLGIFGWMIALGFESTFIDPNVDTLWLSLIGAALLTFVTYQATKK